MMTIRNFSDVTVVDTQTE